MQPPPPEQYIEARDAAPHSIQELLWDQATWDALATISTRHNAPAGLVADVVALALVGFVSIKNFMESLQDHTNIDPNTAQRLAYDIRREIFAPVAHELAEMQKPTAGNPSP
jgi:hypothetical protein